MIIKLFNHNKKYEEIVAEQISKLLGGAVC